MDSVYTTRVGPIARAGTPDVDVQVSLYRYNCISRECLIKRMQHNFLLVK